MVDEYLQRDDQGIVVLDGSRSGEDRRINEDRREKKTLQGFGYQNNRQQISRREPGERRVGPFFTVKDIDWHFLPSFLEIAAARAPRSPSETFWQPALDAVNHHSSLVMHHKPAVSRFVPIWKTVRKTAN